MLLGPRFGINDEIIPSYAPSDDNKMKKNQTSTSEALPDLPLKYANTGYNPERKITFISWPL